MNWLDELTDDQRGLVTACRQGRLTQTEARWAGLVNRLAEMLEAAGAADAADARSAPAWGPPAQEAQEDVKATPRSRY